MCRSDIFVYYDDVQYDKHGWRNRNQIKTPTGTRWLTVPVRHHGLNHPPINEIRIESSSPWARKQIGTLRQFYSEAPHAKRYLLELEAILEKPWERLVDLNIAVIAWLAQAFRIERPLYFSSSLDVGGAKSERLVNLCQHFGATHYLSGNAARDYLEESVFTKRGIQVEWQDFVHPVYPQRYDDFKPYLSALDLLLNVGDESLPIIQGQAGK